MKPKSKTFQWCCFYILALLGTVTFIFLAGEEDPNQPIALSQFLLVKGLALLGFLLCFLIGKVLYKKGWIPEIEDKDV